MQCWRARSTSRWSTPPAATNWRARAACARWPSRRPSAPSCCPKCRPSAKPAGRGTRRSIWARGAGWAKRPGGGGGQPGGGVGGRGEAGWPEYLAFNGGAAAVSAKTPAVVVEQLGALFAQAGQTRQVQDYYRKQGTELIMSSAAGLRRYQTDEIARWKRLMDITGIGLQ